MKNLISPYARKAYDILKSLPDEAINALQNNISWEPELKLETIVKKFASQPYFCPVTSQWRRATYFTQYIVKDGLLICGVFYVDETGKVRDIEFHEVNSLMFAVWEQQIGQEYFDDQTIKKCWTRYWQWCKECGEDPLGELIVTENVSIIWEATIIEHPEGLLVTDVRQSEESQWYSLAEAPPEVAAFLCVDNLQNTKTFIRTQAVSGGIEELHNIEGITVKGEKEINGTRSFHIIFSVASGVRAEEIKLAAEKAIQAA